MEWTATRIVPAILGGGVAIGLLASTAVNTRPKAPPEPEWRLAAREAAFRPSNYSYVDHGPIDLSPNLPWIGTGPDGSMAPMPEDFYRGRIIPIRADSYAVVQEPVERAARMEFADATVDDRSDEIREQVDESSLRPAVAEQRDEPRFRVEQRLPEQAYDDEEEVEEADFGG